MRLEDFCVSQEGQCDWPSLNRIFQETRDAASQIIARKRATFYAVAAGLLRIVESILRDQHTVLSVSSLVEGSYGITDICLSLPSIINRSGLHKVLQLNLNKEEQQKLRKSADVLKKSFRELKAA